MDKSVNEVFISLITLSIVLVLLVLFLITFAFLFQRRQSQFRAEKQALHESYQREILKAQIESQNQTLQHVAGELHDHIGQLLSVVMLQLNTLDEDLIQTTHHPAVQQTTALIEQVLADLRVLSRTLNTDAVSKLGLPGSITLELDRIQRTGRYETQLTASGETRRLDPQVEIVLFRMVQESLSNVLKHARAKTITVNLDYQPDLFTLRITDNGRGFVLSAPADPQQASSGQGLQNLYRRSTLLGGSCTVVSQPGEGCLITIQLPTV
jgi:signal transduction histidine kinase